MRILLATYWELPHVGGVWTYLEHLKRELECIGHEVDIFAQHPDLKRYYILNKGQFLEKCSLKDPITKKLTGYFEKRCPQMDPWIFEKEVERYTFEAAASTLGLESYDLIHTQDIVSTRALWRIKPNHIPLLATIHGCLATEYLISGEIQSKDTLRFRYTSSEEYYGATSSDLTLLPTNWLYNLYVNDFNIPQDHLQIVSYGMDFDLFAARAKQVPVLTRPEGKTVLACPARLVHVKGHKCLLQALASLKQVRSDWVCWLLGDGELRKELEEQCLASNLEQHVVFLGNRSDVPTLLKQSDVFLLPSLQDNQPFSLIEAQVAGKPVIVSDAGGIPEMVEHGKTGLIFKAGDSNALYEHLKAVLEDANLRQRLAAQGQEWAQTQWSLKTMLDHTLEAYQKVINKRRL